MRQFSKLKVADYVRKTREARGLSLRQTAKKAGLTLARCFAIENGEARLNLPQLASLADAFGFKWRRDADSLRSAERLQEASEAEKASDGCSMIPLGPHRGARLQNLGFRSALESGDVLCLMPMDGKSERTPYALRLQLIEADRLVNPVLPAQHRDVHGRR